MTNKKIRGKLKKLIFNDKYLVIVSLLLAVVVWIVTSINIGDKVQRTITIDAPIKLSDEASEQLGMQYYSLQDSVELKVTLSGAKYIVGQVKEEDLSVNFDTNSIGDITGKVSIPIKVRNSSNNNLDFTVKSVKPSKLEAYHDINMGKTFDVYVDYNNKENIADGYELGTPVLSEDKVVVNGPKSTIEEIEKVFLNVDFGDKQNIKKAYNTECPIEYKGQGIQTKYLSVTSRTDSKTSLDKISVTIPVLKIETLPVKVEVENEPEGYYDGQVSIKYTPEEIEAGVLESAKIKEAVVGTINFKDVTLGDNTFDFNISDLKGITVDDENNKTITAKVSVSDMYSIRTKAIKRSDILVKGLKDNQEGNVRNLDKYYVTIIMPNDDSVDDIELELSVDVSKTTKDNVYPINVKIKNNDNAWVYSEYNATVDIT